MRRASWVRDRGMKGLNDEDCAIGKSWFYCLEKIGSCKRLARRQ